MANRSDMSSMMREMIQLAGTVKLPSVYLTRRQVTRAVAAVITLIQELVAASLFVIGPFLLLVIPTLNGLIVSFFKNTATRLHREEKVAEGYGLDLAAYFTRNLYRFWHAQEFRGLENIPRSGGALLVYYHGPLPTDYIGLVAEIRYQYGRHLRSVVDRMMANFFLADIVNNNLGLVFNGRSQATEILKEGHLLGVAPGGVREALFSEDYKVVWGERTGFAKVAFDANVPIIPVFTENSQETFKSMKSFQFVWKFIYDKIKFPIIPLWGGFPVKLVTHIGAPIYPSKAETVEDLRDRTKTALEDMILKHQSRNPSVTKAILQRLRNVPSETTILEEV